ncbi:MAG: S9 family peptidase [Rickettsiaceae bacterium]|nr:MAG: S9 family peptidase [Rickettsiaceae bacterium]
MLPPIAKKITSVTKVHDQDLYDDYAWLRDPKWPVVNDTKILNYLEAENKYHDHFFGTLSKEQEIIFQELKSRIKLEDQSTHIKRDNYYYYTRTETDQEYIIYCRKLGQDGNEEILLDVNKLARDNKFVAIGDFSISPDHKLMAYSVNVSGDESYDIKIFDLAAKKYLSDRIDNTSGDIVWHEKIPGLFYVPVSENWRFNKVMFHYLGQSSTDDQLIFHELDPMYNVSVDKSASRKFIFINVGGYESNENLFISMDDINFNYQTIFPRAEGVYYYVDHGGDYFYLSTNLQAKDFKILKTKADDYQSNQWQTLIDEKPNQYLDSFDLSKNYLILNYKVDGLPLISIVDLESMNEKTINFPDQSFEATAAQANFAEDDIRIFYSSLVRPSTTYSYDFYRDKLSVLKTQEISSGFASDEYRTERIWADTDNDDIKVPISLFYKKSLMKKDGTNPLYLYGYGAYGIGIATTFRNSAVTLADRGFVFAIAHIRGGNELGQDWYESAKFLNKGRTFADFISSAEHLIAHNYTSKGNIVIWGGSAGGMLVGNVANTRPELFRAVIAHSPFVDILNTMLDDTLPLTPGEFKEWGNPQEKEYFECIKSYDVYGNIKAQQYPAMLINAGISDPRVGYWEAAKWVAKMRALKTDDNILIFKTDMSAGHKGPSGRFDYLKEAADDIVFVFSIFDIKY